MKYLKYLVLLTMAVGPFMVLAQTSKTADNSMSVKTNALDKFTRGQADNVLNLHGEGALKTLEALTPQKYHDHPEFGKVPHNTQCENCVELIHKRTASTRHFVDIDSPNIGTYIQRSRGDLHYKDDQGQWITINPYLHPLGSTPGLFRAADQPVPTSIDLNSGFSVIDVNGFDFKFNKNVTLYHYTGSQWVDQGAISINNTTVGSDGAYTDDAWPGIDRRQVVDISEIETDYILQSQPSLPTGVEAMVFEDAVALPADYSVQYDHNADGFYYQGFWVGDVVVLDQNNEEVVRWHRPGVYDQGRQHITSGAYNIERSGNTWKIRVLVSATWLRDSANYPVTVDPLVSGSNTYSSGSIGFSQFSDDGSGYCGNSLQYCSATMSVNVPGQSQIVDVVWTADYETNCTDLCTNHTCFMDDGGFLMAGPCGVSPQTAGNWWSCQTSPSCSYCGTCNGSNNSEPFLADCVAPQCPNYSLNFELRNIHCNVCGQASCSDFSCSTTCHYTPNNTWTVTVYARTVENTAQADGNSGTITVDCPDLPVQLCCNDTFGVPGYSNSWTDGSNTWSGCCISVNPPSSSVTDYIVTTTDACGNTIQDTVTVDNICTLPIELVSFYGQKAEEGIRLDWKTATEQDNDYFEIQRKGDQNGTFKQIAKIDGAGDAQEEREYHYVDREPLDGENYYRLKQVDSDGSASYSWTVSVPWNKQQVPRFYPQPATNRLYVENIQLSEAASNELYLLNTTGRVLKKVPVDEASSGRLLIDVSDLPSGLYFIRFNDNIYKISVY